MPFDLFTVCGLDELEGHRETRATHVLSILDPGEPEPEAFGAYGEHARLELRFHDIIEAQPGLILPTETHVEQILAFGRDASAEENVRLLVHCHAGISRSTASLTLILAQAHPELTAEEILGRVHATREKAWPNLRMIEFGDKMLNRNGNLIRATSALHRRQIERRPHIAEFHESVGRSREVEAALALA